MALPPGVRKQQLTAIEEAICVAGRMLHPLAYPAGTDPTLDAALAHLGNARDRIAVALRLDSYRQELAARAEKEIK